MGGYGSNRWGGTHVRATTGDGLRLPIASLKPYLAHGTWKMVWQWKRGDAVAAMMGLSVNREGVTLDYTITRGDYEPQMVRDAVPVAWTNCTYGGERAWFVCPSCETRRSTLYLPPGATHFRCRECHKLAYSTQQMDAHDRHMHHIHKIQARLDGGKGDYSPFRVPPKPKGMQWVTYFQLHDQFLMHELARQKMLQAQFEVHRTQWMKQGSLPG